MTAFKMKKKEIKKESVGVRLKEARTLKGIDLETVEQATKIRLKYLQALEEEDWQSLPSDPYIQGFLRGYCQFLEIPWQPLLSQYKRERGVENTLKKKLLPPRKEVKYPRIYITPSLLFILFLSLVALGVFFYIGYQVSGFAKAPYLLIKFPTQGEIISENTVYVEGKTSKGASLYINGQLLGVDTEGNFKQAVKLKEGSNTISISALNRVGKKTEKNLVIIFKPKGEP